MVTLTAKLSLRLRIVTNSLFGKLEFIVKSLSAPQQMSGLPCSVNEIICVRPVRQEVGSFLVVHSDVHVREGIREKVVNLPGYIQNVAHAGKQTETKLATVLTQQNTVHIRVLTRE